MNHTIIIGGGLGGLFTACILAKEGMKVTVIEKNPTLGGGLQSFRRFGETFDAGMHILGGIQPGGSIYKIVNYLGIADRIHVRPVDADCTDEIFFVEDNATFRIRQGREGFMESLAEHFPDEREGLKAYVDAIYNIADSVDMFNLRPLKGSIQLPTEDFLQPVGDFIAQYVKNPRLQSVLGYMNPLYGGEKDSTPAYIHAIINVLYINGGSRFEGGSYRFVDELVRFIRDHGGEIVSGDAVSSISTEDRLVTRVTTKSGRTFSADWYISAIHPCALLRLMDSESALPKSYHTRLDSIPNTYSAFMLYIKLKPGTMRYFNYMGYIMNRYDEIWNLGDDDSSWPHGLMYLTTPELQQGEYSNKMIITVPMPWSMVSKWEHTTLGHRTRDYEEWKERCIDRLMALMDFRFPHFRETYVEAINSASPLTIRDYYGVKEGSMYGYHKDCNNIMLSQLPVMTKVRNLLLTGQNNNLHGFCGVPLTAINTCEAIFGMNHIINKINEAKPEA